VVGGSNGAVSRFSSTGVFKWTHNAPGTTPGLMSLAVDSVGRTFAATSDASSKVSIRQVTLGGTLGFKSDLPSGFFPWVLRVDANGNLYAAGGSDNGVGGRVPAYGAYDGVVMRNPHLLFP
jgi:hypothetical protein